ncbi:hypothetical protein JOD21_001226 [Jeotgalibacillus terrae]|nr:hypothetical protein [Jeotgalibacillus terrae]MBM7578566.1 hypothetical protein [Jeotgalibacillus terrae]
MMKHIYAFEDIKEYETHKDIIQRFSKRLEEYQYILEKEYLLMDQPKGIIWTSAEAATTVFSEIPIPAFTNKNTIYITPDVAAWRKLFVEQLDGKDLPHIERFYKELSENHILQILGHELTHHSDLFLEDFDDEREDSIWFEEGMCEYLPRKFLLSEKEFDEITAVEEELVEAFSEEYGDRSIDEFGSGSYTSSLSSIMFDYWRSYLYIKHLVEVRFKDDIQAVFEEYHKWDQEGRICSLSEYFELDQ